VSALRTAGGELEGGERGELIAASEGIWVHYWFLVGGDRLALWNWRAEAEGRVGFRIYAVEWEE
jgi:hypothetical protein